MADAVQPQQRNLYQTKFLNLEYCDGKGTTYNEQLRQLSWPVADDVPLRAQRSPVRGRTHAKYDNHHQMGSMKSSGLSFMQTHGGRSERIFAASDPNLAVHARLFSPSKTVRAEVQLANLKGQVTN